MLFRFRSLHFLWVLGVFSLFSLPSLAQASVTVTNEVAQKDKGKKGDNPPRPRPKPGHPEGGDED